MPLLDLYNRPIRNRCDHISVGSISAGKYLLNVRCVEIRSDQI
jgi:hypothetical protein